MKKRRRRRRYILTFYCFSLVSFHASNPAIGCKMNTFRSFVHSLDIVSHQPLDQANRLQWQACLYRQPVNRIHHCDVLSLLSLKADTHFTAPWRVEGWVDIGGGYIPRCLPAHRSAQGLEQDNFVPYSLREQSEFLQWLWHDDSTINIVVVIIIIIIIIIIIQNATNPWPRLKQATLASTSSNESSHTVPHRLLCRISSRPVILLGPPTSLTAVLFAENTSTKSSQEAS